MNKGGNYTREYKSFKDAQTAVKELLPTGHLPEAKQLKIEF